MAWNLKWGAHVKAFNLQYKKSGVKPAPLKSRPTLKPVDAAYNTAFNALSRSRPTGMHGSSAILISEILAYCELMGIANPQLRVKYLNLMQEMDQVCLDHWAELQKQTKK